MRNLYRFGLAASVMMVLAAGGLSFAKSTGQAPATGSTVSGSADIDARRTELVRRIEVGRQAGKLRGVGYFALLDEQHKLLVAQRRAEAQGVSDDARRQLNAALDRASANIERHLASN